LLWFRMIMTVLQPRLPRAMRASQRLDLAFEGKTFCIWMEDRTGLAVFEEVFVRGEYAVDIQDPNIIIDVGANIGVASIYFCLRYPNARLYAIEPNPEVCKTLKKNLAAFPNVSIHQCSLADTNGDAEFHMHPTSSIASSLQSRARGEKIVSVLSKTLDTFMKEQHIQIVDLLKFDIEGAEDRMLRSIKDMKVVRCYIGEIHPDLMQSSLEDITRLFSGFTVKLSPIAGKRYTLMAVIN
ncbi:MAG: FkbM family methyltransferase, partial [Patescibacteria group bacterium]